MIFKYRKEERFEIEIGSDLSVFFWRRLITVLIEGTSKVSFDKSDSWERASGSFVSEFSEKSISVILVGVSSSGNTSAYEIREVIHNDGMNNN